VDRAGKEVKVFKDNKDLKDFKDSKVFKDSKREQVEEEGIVKGKGFLQ